MSIINLSDHLATLSYTPDYGRLFTRAKYLIEVQKHLLNIIPSQLRKRCTIGQHTTEGLLVIYVDNGAVATRLRNSTSSIQQKMNEAGIKVDSIKFRVLPRPYSRESVNTYEIRHSLSQTAIDHLSKLSDSLPAESPLQSSLKSLLANSCYKPAM